MAVTLKARSGKTFRYDVFFWQPPDGQGNQTLVNTTGSTARVQLRGAQVPRRVLLSSHEYNTNDSPPVGTILFRVEPGHWKLYLSKSVTRSLPPRVTFEFELASDADPEDVTPLFEGVLLVEPELVTNA